MDTDIEKIIAAAKAGGKVLQHYFGQSLETVIKSNASDFRTKADVQSEKAIIDLLGKKFPDYTIHSEEAGTIQRQSDYTFVIDPLDGTNNFVLGIPNFSVSIGLVQGDTIIAGVIYCPMVDYVYHATRGNGAYFDGTRLAVNNETNLANATVAYTCHYQWDAQEQVRLTGKLYGNDAKRVMVNWAPTYDFCMLAAGRIEAIVNSNTELYDFAAGKLIAMEAGAICTNQDGTPERADTNRKFIISSTDAMCRQLVTFMNQITA